MAIQYYGLNELDKKLEEYVNYDNGFYVELGANDGVSQSNSLYFEQHRHWRGILIEPTPHKYLACCEARGEKNAIHCNACVAFDYKDKFVEIRYANLMSVSNSLTLDLPDTDAHLNSAQQYLPKNEHSFTFGAVAKPLTDILKSSNAPSYIDFLSLDVEGAELEVLKGLDFNAYRFKYMLIESRSQEKLEEFLANHEYKLKNKLSKHDYLFSSEPTD